MIRRLTLLAALGVSLLGAKESSPTRDDAGVQLDELAREIVEHREVGGRLPSSLEGVERIASDETLLVDPWGNPVFYLRVAGGFWLMSWGADGVPGGDGDAADVVHIAR